MNISIMYEEWNIDIEKILNKKEILIEILEILLPFDFLEIKGNKKTFISKYEKKIEKLMNNNEENFCEENYRKNINNWKNSNIIPSSKILFKILNNKKFVNEEDKKLIQKIFLKRVGWKLWKELDNIKKIKNKKRIKEFLISLIKVLKEIGKKEISEKESIMFFLSKFIKNKKKLGELKRVFNNINIEEIEYHMNNLNNKREISNIIEELEFKENKEWKKKFDKISKNFNINEYRELIKNLKKNNNNNNIERLLIIRGVLNILNKNKEKFTKREFERLEKKLKSELEERNIIYSEEYGMNLNFLINKLLFNFTLPQIENKNFKKFEKFVNKGLIENINLIAKESD